MTGESVTSRFRSRLQRGKDIKLRRSTSSDFFEEASMFSVCDSAEDSTRPFRAARIRDQRDYVRLHALSVSDPDAFWGRVAREFCWRDVGPGAALCSRRDFDPAGGGPVRWFEGWETNICFNALDRNVAEGLGHRVAYHWEGNGLEERTSVTYRQLLRQVCQFANVLKRKGVKKGDRVTVYLPMIVEAVTAMLACARIGATHNVVFAGFSSESLAERMIDAQSNLLVTADGTWRGNKLINLKELADGAVKRCRESQLPVKCIVVRHLAAADNNNHDTNLNHVHHDTNHNHCPSDDPHRTPPHDIAVPWDPSVDCWWHEEMSTASPSCDPEWVDSHHPLFILYTSGSTGKPKGVVHGTGGYMVYAATTFQLVFAHAPSDVYFCTADLGWITGHTYGIYGPLLQGATSILFQGIPTHPDPGRYWAIVERYGVSKFYTAPTALRTLRKYGDSYVTRYRLDSLEVLGSVGEPIDPDTWWWYQGVVGGGRCQIVDTFWQSETGGHMITPLPGCTPQKPGSAGLPFFGVVPAILDDQGTEIEGPGEGHLVFKQPWPGMMLTLFGSQERFEATYFRKFPGYYCSGDGARRDEQGLYWITGRTDDLLNVSGHLLSTAEVEAALASHSACAEAAAVAAPHPVKGECLHCFVVLTKDAPDNVDLVSELKETVRSRIGAFACPDRVRLCPCLPKTRSGKVMRRVLRKVAAGGLSGEEDLSTLADPLALQQLISSAS